ncbi:MAG: hypothetical protein NWE92_04415 [Candidatus Bathyarchaeota archaeon]|nr:hypothetical protein [Candidatus Bathyarchaeota archaeon]
MNPQTWSHLASIVTFAAACLCVAVSLIYFFAANVSWSYTVGWAGGINWYAIYYAVTAAVGVAAFALGVTAGYFARKRMRWKLALVGSALLVAAGAMMTFPLYFYGVPMLGLALVSVASMVASKAAFQ